jgi:hypothetical protein
MEKLDKLIGQGAQFKVFDVGSQVRKVPNNKPEVLEVLRSWDTKSTNIALEKEANMLINDRTESIEKIRKSKVDLSIIGNPKFLSNGEILQDKVVILGDALERSEEKEWKKLIDGYIDNIFLQWRYGFADRIFNFTVNNGVTKQGEIVLIDFCEITFDKDRVLSHINYKKWESSAALRWHIKDEKLKQYFLEQMDNRVTKEALEKNWNYN